VERVPFAWNVAWNAADAFWSSFFWRERCTALRSITSARCLYSHSASCAFFFFLLSGTLPPDLLHLPTLSPALKETGHFVLLSFDA